MVQSCERSVFTSASTAVVTALGYLEEDGDSKARCYLLSIKNVDYIIALVPVEHVLQSRLPLTTFILSKQYSITSAKEATATITQLQQESANPKVWNALIDSAVQLAGRFEIEASNPRNDGRQRHRAH